MRKGSEVSIAPMSSTRKRTMLGLSAAESSEFERLKPKRTRRSLGEFMEGMIEADCSWVEGNAESGIWRMHSA